MSQKDAFSVKNTILTLRIIINTGLKSADSIGMANGAAKEKVESKIDYALLEQQRTDALRDRLKNQLHAREVGKNATLRRIVLRFVADGKYKDANEILEEYIKLKSVYPRLVTSSRSHVVHAKQLINAIRAKRNFPNLSQLAMSKQQEILDHAIAHFEELKKTLQVIEAIVKSQAITDLRSTVWVIRTFIYTVVVIIIFSFLNDFSGSMGKPFWHVFNDFADNTFQFLANLF